MTDVFLLFPPDCREINEPCINTTELAAYLRKQGIKVRQYDANIKFQNYMYTEEGFEDLRSFSLESCRESRSQCEQFSWLSNAEKSVLLPLLQEACYGIKKEEGYYDFEHYYRYKSIHHRYISAVHAMTRQKMVKQEYRTLEDISSLISSGTPYDSFIFNKLLPVVLRESPVLVNLFVSSYDQLIPALILGRNLKLYGIHTVLSDRIPTYLRKDIKNMPDLFFYIDGVVLYEQEHAIPALLRQIRAGEVFSKVPNYIFCDNGIVQQTWIEKPISVDEIPVPDFSDYEYSDCFSAARVLPYSTSRGCAWGKCLFCHLHKGSSQYAEKSPEKVTADIKSMIKKYHINTVLFFDNLILPDRLLEIANSLLAENVNIKWNAITKPTREILPKEAETLYRAGCRHLEIEIESVNQELHRIMHTGVDPDIVWKTLYNTRKAGIINSACLLYGGWGERVESFSLTNKSILEHKDIVNAVIPFQFYLAKDSELYDLHDAYGLELPEHSVDLSAAYFDFSGKEWADRQEREAGASELFQMTSSVFPYFRCSYFPIINYICYYQCSDPVKLAEAADRRKRDKGIIPVMHSYILKLQDAGLNGESVFFNLINGRRLPYSDSLRSLMPYIDGKASALEIVYSAADHMNINRGVAMLKFLPVLNQYHTFIG